MYSTEDSKGPQAGLKDDRIDSSILSFVIPTAVVSREESVSRSAAVPAAGMAASRRREGATPSRQPARGRRYDRFFAPLGMTRTRTNRKELHMSESNAKETRRQFLTKVGGGMLAANVAGALFSNKAAAQLVVP